MSQQFNVSPDNFRMAVDYIADFEDWCKQIALNPPAKVCPTIATPFDSMVRKVRSWLS
jgi:hypothetical protein